MLTSFRKAFKLLDAFTLEAPEWSLAELNQKFDMPKPTVHHIMAALIEGGWVAQDSKTKRYRLGIRLWEKGWLAVNQLGLRELAKPSVEELAETSGETVHLAILDSVDPSFVVYVDKIESSQPVRAYSMIGGRAPSYCVATGKAILSWNPDVVERIVIQKLHAYTKSTITDPDRLVQELRLIQRRGFSINRGEYRAGVTGIAAPIHDHDGRVLYGVGISGPSYRIPAEVIKKLAPIVIATAQKISTQLGFIDRMGRDGKPLRSPRGRTGQTA